MIKVPTVFVALETKGSGRAVNIAGGQAHVFSITRQAFKEYFNADED